MKKNFKPFGKRNDFYEFNLLDFKYFILNFFYLVEHQSKKNGMNSNSLSNIVSSNSTNNNGGQTANGTNSYASKLHYKAPNTQYQMPSIPTAYNKELNMSVSGTSVLKN